MSTVTDYFSINEFEPTDIGKFVYHIGRTKEKGKVKSYDNQRKVAWIVFLCNDNWENFNDYTANMCEYRDIVRKNINS